MELHLTPPKGENMHKKTEFEICAAFCFSHKCILQEGPYPPIKDIGLGGNWRAAGGEFPAQLGDKTQDGQDIQIYKV